MSDFIEAVKNGDLEKVKLLLPISDPSEENNLAIRSASYNGYTEIVKLLLADPRIIDPSAGDNQAIRAASNHGYTEIVKLLLADPRVDPSANTNHAIRLAAEYGHLEIVKLLLADPRVDPSISVLSAAEYGYLDVVKLLLSDPRVNPSIHDNYAIREAARNGHIEIVKLLLSDPRVDWRGIDREMENQLLKDADVGLKHELKTSLLSINRMTPKMRIEKEEQKSLIPKSVRKNIIYRAPYEELCSLIKGEIPPIKLVALANLLKISYENNISWKELCGKVKFKLLEML